MDNVTINGTAGADHYLGVDRERCTGHLWSVEQGHHRALRCESTSIHINGVGGDDVIDVANLGSNGPQVIVDGGDGHDVAHVDPLAVHVDVLNSEFHLV